MTDKTKTTSIEQVAMLISQLTFSELSKIGDDLHAMTRPEEGVWDLTKQIQWAEMLNAWAQSIAGDNSE
jgi:hypothetical protein